MNKKLLKAVLGLTWDIIRLIGAIILLILIARTGFIIITGLF